MDEPHGSEYLYALPHPDRKSINDKRYVWVFERECEILDCTPNEDIFVHLKLNWVWYQEKYHIFGSNRWERCINLGYYSSSELSLLITKAIYKNECYIMKIKAVQSSAQSGRLNYISEIYYNTTRQQRLFYK